MVRSGVDQVAVSQLFYVPQPLKVESVDYLPEVLREFNYPMDTVSGPPRER